MGKKVPVGLVQVVYSPKTLLITNESPSCASGLKITQYGMLTEVENIYTFLTQKTAFRTLIYLALFKSARVISKSQRSAVGIRRK